MKILLHTRSWIPAALAATALLACAGKTAPAAAPGPAPKPVGLADLPGFTGDDVGVETFGREDLFNAINGAAELYLAYGFDKLWMREYRAEGSSIRVMLFDMGTPLEAFGVFAKERPAGATALDVGGAAVAWPPRQCSMFAARFYAKVDALEGQLDAARCRPVLEAVAAGLPGEVGPPPEFGDLPPAARDLGLARFTPSGFLGLGELKGCLHAELPAAGETKPQVFAVVRDPETVWADLATKWQAVEAESPMLVREVPYRGAVVVTKTARGLLGVAGAGDRAAAVKRLTDLAERLDAE